MKQILAMIFCTHVLLVSAQTKDSADWAHIKGELEGIFKTDQAMRKESSAMLADARAKGIEVDKSAHADLWKRIGAQDRANQIQVAEIVGKYGWPRQSQVGSMAALAAFLVVQHGDLDFQLKFIGQLREAAAVGEAQKESVALLEDRVLIRQGKPQRYGSQVDTRNGVDLLPTEDETNLDARRASMGLPPICKYLENFVKTAGKIVYPPCLKKPSEETSTKTPSGK